MAFRENFLKLIQDDSLRERLTGKGRERAAGRYHYRRLAGEMSALYHRLLAEKSHLPASKTG